MANNINQTKWADHLRGCAGMANEIAGILDIRDDAPRQAMFATIVISAVQHHVFLEPIPESETPVISPETAAVESNATKKGVDAAAAVKLPPTVEGMLDAAKDELMAQKADAQIKGVPRNPTPETAEGGRRTAFLAGIESARTLLNKEGHQPPITPGALAAVIKHDFAPKTNLGSLDSDELERLMIFLNSKLEVLREKNAKAKTSDDEIDF